mgnify:CR=1 FL=1
MDKITIKSLTLYAYHGVNPEEKENGQKFILDVTYYLDLSAACQSDNLDDTVSYAQVVKIIRKVFCEQSYDLIERAAQVVCDALFEAFDKIEKIEITLQKPDAPVRAEFDYMAVTLQRERTR